MYHLQVYIYQKIKRSHGILQFLWIHTEHIKPENITYARGQGFFSSLQKYSFSAVSEVS